VEAVEYFCFHFHLRIKLVATEFASASSLFLQSASASPSRKFNRFHRFRFQSPLPHPCRMFYEKCFRFRLFNKSNASKFASASSFCFSFHQTTSLIEIVWSFIQEYGSGSTMIKEVGSELKNVWFSRKWKRKQ